MAKLKAACECVVIDKVWLIRDVHANTISPSGADALHKVIAACELVVLDTYLIMAVGLHVFIATYTNHLLANAHRLRS